MKTFWQKKTKRCYIFIKENCLCNYVDGRFVIFVDAKKNLCLKDLNGYKYRTVVRCVNHIKQLSHYTPLILILPLILFSYTIGKKVKNK